MLDVSLTDPLGDPEIARVERGHEIGVDQQWGDEVPRRALLGKLRKLPPRLRAGRPPADISGG
jgi:hypothetical protein